MDVVAIHGNETLFDALCARIRGKVPGFRIRYKNESRWQKFIGVLAFFNPGYMTEFVTTQVTDVWYPSREFIDEDKMRAFRILAHEYSHLLDRKAHPVVFEILYVSPQILFVLSLAAIAAFFVSNWWLCALGALLFLLPIPAYGRATLEMRGYTMDLAISYWRHASIQQESIDRIAGRFTGWEYYKMWPFKRGVYLWINEAIRRIRNIDEQGPRGQDTILNDSEAYVDVYELLTGIDFD